jgi:hypothetical protein
MVLIWVPLIAYGALSGDLDNREPDCDSFCHDTAGGVVVSVFFLGMFAIPTSIVGGVVSWFASAGRAPHSA